MSKNELEIIPQETIENRIYVIRRKKVLLDRDLAKMYGVETKVLKQAVRRNIDRFPDDFMFELSKQEFKDWRSQIVTSKSDKIGLRYAPMAFAEQGVSMLSSILKSKRAIQVNISIMRAFINMRNMIMNQSKLWQKIEEMEKNYDYQFKIVFDALRELGTEIVKLKEPSRKSKRKIGFKSNNE